MLNGGKAGRRAGRAALACYLPSPAAPRLCHSARIYMKELMRSNNLVEISWVEALLGSAGIPCAVLDLYTSAVEGSINAIPRRVMVDDDDLAEARRLIQDATPTGS